MKIIITVFLFLITIKGFSQSANEIHNLINRSIDDHIVSIEKQIVKKTIPNDYINRITLLNDNLPDSFEFSKNLREKYNIRFLNHKDFSRSELKKGIVTFQLYPIVLKGDTIQITIGDANFSKKGKKVFLSYGNWYTTSTYVFSCQNKQWEFIKVEENGI